MPVEGLPSTVELLINQLLRDGEMSSFKIAGNRNCTTVVLRFTDTTATHGLETPVSLVDPGQWRRKPPSQIKRDQNRRQGFHTRLSTSLQSTMSTPGQLTLTDHSARGRDSGLELSVLSTQANKSDNTAIHEEKRHSTKISKQSEENVLNTSNHARGETSHSSQNEDDTQQMKGEQCLSDSDSSDLSASDTDSNTSGEDCEAEEKEQEAKTLAHKERTKTASSDVEQSTKIDFSILGDQEKIDQHISYIRTLPPQVKERLIDKHRNQVIERIVYDERTFSYLAETDDIILEYSYEFNRLDDWYTIGQERNNSYLPDTIWRLRRWPDRSEDRNSVEDVKKCIRALQIFCSMY